MADVFLGTWIMQPDLNDYQFGNPPQKGSYIIETDGEGYLVTMNWTTADGKDMTMDYHAIPDGKEYPTDPATGVDSMSMTRMSNTVLDSVAMKNGVMVAYGSRILSDDGNTMTVKQSGKTPDGQEFINTSVYVRQTD